MTDPKPPEPPKPAPVPKPPEPKPPTEPAKPKPAPAPVPPAPKPVPVAASVLRAPKRTTYERLSDTGNVRDQITGSTFTPAGENAFIVPAAQLHDLAPRAGDIIDTGGKRYRVVEVSEANGTYTLTCEPEGGDK